MQEPQHGYAPGVNPEDKDPLDVWRWISAAAILVMAVGVLLLVIAALRVAG